MKKITTKILVVMGVLLIGTYTFALDVTNENMTSEINHQKRISDIGTTILNANKIDKQMVFTYNKGQYKKTPNDPTITKRQIIFYEEYFKYTENDDELAAFLAQQISRAVQSYSGMWGGFVAATQVKAAQKKYEIFADKRAVDYLVKAGYNPIGLITFINKSATNGFLDKIFHNSPTKRMATVYEYIYFNYPYYLKENSYITNKTYQNFLLNSVHNREMLKEKVKTGSTKDLKYE